MPSGLTTGGSGASTATNWNDEYLERIRKLAAAAKQKQGTNLAVNSALNGISKVNPERNIAANAYNDVYGGTSGSNTGQAAGRALSSSSGGGGFIGPSGASPSSVTPASVAPGAKSGIDTSAPNEKFAGYSGYGIPTFGVNNKWYGNIQTAATKQYADDPSQAAYEYGKKNGYSDYAISQLQDWIDPSYAFLLQQGDKTGGSIADQLDYYGGAYDYGMKPARQTSGAGNGFDPAGVMSRLLAVNNDVNVDPSKKDKDGKSVSALGSLIYGTSSNVSDQVNALIETTKNMLRGMVSDEQLGAYINTLTKEGQAFVSWKNQSGNQKLTGNFGKWLSDRLGATGGF